MGNIVSHMDKLDRNEYFDHGESVIVPPRREDLQHIDKDELLRRLDGIESPKERLKQFLISQLYINDAPTHEAVIIRAMGFSGVLIGGLLGGIIRSRDITETFIRNHNAAVFDNKHVAQRKYVDTFVLTIVRKGAKVAAGCYLLSTAAGLIGFGSITYRNDLYLPDWLVCFGALGAVTRCWLGLRGVVAGAGLGLVGGTIGFGAAKFCEAFTGYSVTQLRYINHMQYLEQQELKLSALQRIRQQEDVDRISTLLS